MIKYRYQTSSIYITALDEIINERGNKGWRLAHIMPDKNNYFRCVFEKMIIPE